MKKIILLAACSACFIACKQKPVSTEANKPLATLFDKYYEERLQIFPLEATSIGDSRYNDKLYVDFTDSYRAKEKIFFQKYLDSLVKYNRDELNDDDKVSYDDFKKLYYSISEVAEWFKVNPSLLRFWESEFDILQPRKNRKGDRLFKKEDIKNLELIYYLLRNKKYSIEGAKDYLKNNKNSFALHQQLTATLNNCKAFLLELKANLNS